MIREARTFLMPSRTPPPPTHNTPDVQKKIPWRRAWQPTPVFLPEESHGQRSLAGLQSIALQSGPRLKRLSTHAHIVSFNSNPWILNWLHFCIWRQTCSHFCVLAAGLIPDSYYGVPRSCDLVVIDSWALSRGLLSHVLVLRPLEQPQILVSTLSCLPLHPGGVSSRIFQAHSLRLASFFSFLTSFSN